MAIQDKFSRANVIYKITKDIDLGGETLIIPEGCTLDFQGGSFSNGTIVGDLVIRNSKGLKCYVSGSILNAYELYDSKDATINSSIITACKAGINLMEDISIQSCRLHCSLQGNNHNVTFVNQDGADALIIQNEKNIKIEGVNFRKDKSIDEVYKTHILKIADSHNIIITNCYSEGGIDIRTSDTYWETNNENSSNIKIENVNFDIDWTPINNINQEQIYQSDIITIDGLLNVIVKNNYFKFKNINRVFKITAFRTTTDYSTFDNISRTISITNNQIVGVNETDNGKQIIDCFFAGSHLELTHNYIDVSGHYCLIQDKSKSSDVLYKNLHTITGNIIKYDNCLLNLINENSLSVVFKDNYCLLKRDLKLGNVPFSLGHCKSIVVCNNIFESLSTVGSYFDLTHWGTSQAKDTNIDNFIIKDNIFDTTNFILQIVPDTNPITIGYLNIDSNKVSNDTVLVRTRQESFSVSINSVVIKDKSCRNNSAYLVQFKNSNIQYLEIEAGYVLNRRILQVDANTSLNDFHCNLSLTGGINRTALPKIGNTYTQYTYFNTAPDGTEFYNISNHRKVYKDATNNTWRDSSGIFDVSKFGTSSNRPTVLEAGFQYFDTTINKPIFWTGANWVDATGTEV